MKMDKKQKTWLAFGILFGLTIIAIGLNSGFEHNFGTIDVSEVAITSADGKIMVGKLYLPKGVNSTNPAPGVLAIHGYNNDKHVQRPHSLELAKRGVVVLAIDLLDHGDSDSGQSVFTTYPLEAYTWLENQPFVSDKTGVVGHSLGALWANVVALSNPQIEVVGYQAFGPDDLAGSVAIYAAFGTNVIQICSAMEEFGTRQYNQSRSDWEEYCRYWIGLNTQTTGVDDGTTEFSKTYGNIAIGNAQRYVFLWKTHPGQTHDLTATREIVSFFCQSLFGYSEETADAYAKPTTYIYAEICGAASALFLMLSIIPLAGLLLGTRIFADVAQPMPEIRDELKTKQWVWWLFATINFAIGGAVYFFGANAPEGIFGNFFRSWVPDAKNIPLWTPLYDMAVGNGYTGFYVLNAGINVLFVLGWYFIWGMKHRAKGDDLGIYTPSESFSKNLVIIGKTIILAASIFFYMYGITAFSENVFQLEIRGPWSMFKTFTTERAVRFWMYFPGILFFMLFNAGIWLFGLMRQKEHGSEAKTSFIWWLKILFAMITGLVILNIVGYLPMWADISGPIFQNSAIFGVGNLGAAAGMAPMYLLQTWGFLPIAAVLYFIALQYYRKTGRIWLGSIIMAVVFTWLIVTGTVIDPTVLF